MLRQRFLTFLYSLVKEYLTHLRAESSPFICKAFTELKKLICDNCYGKPVNKNSLLSLVWHVLLKFTQPPVLCLISSYLRSMQMPAVQNLTCKIHMCFVCVANCIMFYGNTTGWAECHPLDYRWYQLSLMEISSEITHKQSRFMIPPQLKYSLDLISIVVWSTTGVA